MSKKKTRRQGKSRRKQQKALSFAIPLIVGAVVLAVVVGAILAFEREQSASAGPPIGNAVQASNTEPLSTSPIPYPGVPRVRLQEAQTKSEQGQAVLVDVRGKDLYDKGHAAGAISIPAQEITARLGELPRDKTIILYCT